MANIVITATSHSIRFTAGEKSQQLNYTKCGGVNKNAIRCVILKYDDAENEWVLVVFSNGDRMDLLTFDMVDSVGGNSITTNLELCEEINKLLDSRT